MNNCIEGYETKFPPKAHPDDKICILCLNIKQPAKSETCTECLASGTMRVNFSLDKEKRKELIEWQKSLLSTRRYSNYGITADEMQKALKIECDKPELLSNSTEQEQEQSDGSTASYYELPTGATELQDLISYKDMNAQMGEIFRACYRYGKVAHSSKLRDAKKIKFYIEAEIARLSSYGE